MTDKSSLRLTVTLGVTQIIAWASSYYLPAVLARPIAADMGYPVSVVYAAFSAALIASALTLPVAGRCVDRWGGKRVLVFSNVLCAFSLGLLSQVESEAAFFVSWVGVGCAMGAGLYDMAFAAVVRSRGEKAGPVIVGLTLIAGLASTLCWPVSQYFLSVSDWRCTVLAWGALQLFVALPLNLSLRLPMRAEGLPAAREGSAGERDKLPAMLALALAFVFSSACASVMAGHLPGILQLFGLSAAASVLAGMTFGPMQVSARIIYILWLHRLQPATTAVLATLVMPLGLICLVWQGTAFLVGMTHGLGNGMMSILKGILPLSIFGDKGYGRRQGLLLMPAGLSQALAPFLFSVCLEWLGQGAVFLYVGFSWTAAALFLWLRYRYVKFS